MSDKYLRQLAQKAGVSPQWTDQAGNDRAVAAQSLREILAALGLPAATEAEIRDSSALLDLVGQNAPPLITARVGKPFRLPGVAGASKIAVTLEGGETRRIAPREILPDALLLPAFDEPGYHVAHLPAGDIVIATAPKRCVTFADLKGGTGFGLAAQIYSLRSRDDGGIGNFGGVADLGRAAAKLGADVLSISPVHALFGAEPQRFSPYSPSTRLFYNPLHADPALVLPAAMVAQAIDLTGLAAEMARLSALPQVDWPAAAPARLQFLRKLFEIFQNSSESAEFAKFRQNAGPLLRDHAVFEVLQQKIWREQQIWSWRHWPAGLRDPAGPAVAAFERENAEEVDFQIFLQWLTGQSFGAAQQACRDSGMKAGLITDLAIGMDPDGSHSWSRPADILTSLSIGAPPDYYAAEGQNWGLAALSPRALAANGFAPFIETLRASLRHSGGLRIDHVMGMSRLWLVPQGRGALEGAYVALPQQDLFRLIALESWRHRAMIIGEDLGTTPWGFREFLGDQGIYGMRVLRFERQDHGYAPPKSWSRDAVAMTTTHDMIATAGWWKGADLDDGPRRAQLEADRYSERGELWEAFRASGVVEGENPPAWDGWPAVDAAIGFIAQTPCALKIVAIEDALASEVQPNVPGTTVEKPNWRHRFETEAGRLLDDERAGRRLLPFTNSASAPKT
ncbi:4-alpha-glucanotransferase [uncultured Rhodoblastus sp.]|uniref:4-alpha-glucanotransferase n=1 Tax=uncultured Rhodoblastus sp. TaxID=543037 RepID=UPI0025FDCB5E|nr:4-alpha-glucanotransferase [uncultured Rhodoblastus sp.]